MLGNDYFSNSEAFQNIEIKRKGNLSSMAYATSNVIRKGEINNKSTNDLNAVFGREIKQSIYKIKPKEVETTIYKPKVSMKEIILAENKEKKKL